MANLIATSKTPVFDGMPFTFRAACDCTEINGLTVNYPGVSESASTDASMTFVFKDAHGNDLAGIGNLFAAGAYVRVILDTANRYAYIQNADTNAYLEEQLADKVSSSGGALTGRLTLRQIVLTDEVDYGSTFPTSDLTTGRLFFKKV